MDEHGILPLTAAKIVERAALLEAVAAHRRAGRRIVHCHGCFDIVHPGHIRYLQFARRQGDVLLVSLTGDAGIDKSAEHPYIPQELRAENIAAIEFVDLVYVDPEPTAVALIRAVRPDVYVKGREYEGSTQPGFLAERRAVEECGGTVIFSGGDVVFSSTQLVQHYADPAALRAQRLPMLCRRHAISADSLRRTLARFTGRRIIVAGDIIADRYVLCDAVNVASEAPVISLVQLEERCYLGGAAVVARHVQALGGSPVLIGAVGDDERSAWAVDELEKEGIRTHLLRRIGHLPQKSRFLVDEQKVMKLDDAAVAPLDSVSQRRAAGAMAEEAATADGVIFCDFGYGMLSGNWVEEALPALRRSVGVISADVSGTRSRLMRFTGVDFLAPTEQELRAAVHDYESGLSAVAWRVMNETRARHLLVTLGKRGLVAFDRPSQDARSPEYSARLRSEQIPPLAEHLMDRMGCGDALLAATTLAMTTGAPLVPAAYLGSLAAAIEGSRLGNVAVDRATLGAWIESRAELCDLPAEPPPAPRRVPPQTAAT